MKKLLIILLTSGIIINISYCKVFAISHDIYSIGDVIPNEVYDYIEINYNEFSENIVNYCRNDNIMISANKISFERPYIVYNFQKIQDEVYYYPISDGNEIVCVVSIIGVLGGYTYEISNNMVSALNDIDYHNTDVIFYLINGMLHIETEVGRYTEELSNIDLIKLSPEEKKFYNSAFNIKKQIVITKIENFVPYIDVENDFVDITTKMGNEVKLYNKQFQYNLRMCWAAAAATVINTLKYKGVTGYEVCNRLGKGYNDGGTILDIQDALSCYDVKYNFIRSSRYLYWENITKNIDAGYPLILQLVSSSYGNHAVTLYGYGIDRNKEKILMIWDSNGIDKRNIEYDSTGSFRITEDGIVYTLNSALSYK